jgi:protocatechuate 3,4-dioxygenase beta subunit
MRPIFALSIQIVVFVFIGQSACTQTPKHEQSDASEKQVGGPCEGCEAALEFGSRTLTWVDTLPDYKEAGPKLEVTGTIFRKDGKTPAGNVILYIYHTDQTGHYATRGNETGWGKRHGYIRTWLKTGADGKYKFLTLRPAPYPGRQAPEHIHATIKEEGITPYYIDEYLFDDDEILTPHERDRQPGRGGNGILKLTKGTDGIFRATRNIVLGKNIPQYD